ncbi:MAG: hypothetical protein D6679_07150 [Candidatus Hydrogenedentota bacterium]|nr:MAG: hypothetical protein D6679_07150 [Candidatus Hydrogenedentota bacterium]
MVGNGPVGPERYLTRREKERQKGKGEKGKVKRKKGEGSDKKAWFHKRSPSSLPCFARGESNRLSLHA